MSQALDVTAADRIGRLARQLAAQERRAALHGVEELGTEHERAILESSRRVIVDAIDQMIDELDDPFLRAICEALVDAYASLGRGGEDRAQWLQRACELLSAIPCELPGAVARAAPIRLRVA